MPASKPLERLAQEHVTWADVVRAIAHVRHTTAVAEEILDAVMLFLKGPGRDRVAPVTPISPTVIRLPPRVSRESEKAIYTRMAGAGVASIRILPGDRRRRLVSIDGAAPFSMPTGEAALLEELMRRDGADEEDGFPAFRKLTDIAGPRARSIHAVTMAIHRLRERLRTDGGVSPLLIETRRHEVRLRLRPQDCTAADMGALVTPLAEMSAAPRRCAVLRHPSRAGLSAAAGHCGRELGRPSCSP